MKFESFSMQENSLLLKFSDLKTSFYVKFYPSCFYYISSNLLYICANRLINGSTWSFFFQNNGYNKGTSNVM